MPRLKPLHLIGAALLAASASLASAAPPAPKAADAALCKETGRWLLTSGKRLQPTLPAGPLSEAASSDVVLLGEQHDQDDHHRWQLQVLAALHAQRPDMAIGFEMFPRRLQPVLDRWVAGQLSVREFITQAEWEQVWNFPPQLYLPLFEFARINRIPMIALNVDQKLTRAIADKGWQGVPAAEREGVGRPAAALPAYRDLLRELHRSHLAGRRQAGKGDNSFENFLDAQLTWDRAMAEALAARLGAPAAGQRRPLVVGVMGSGHIRFEHGVPHQLRALGVKRVTSLLPASGREECQTLQPGMAHAVFVLPDRPAANLEPPRLGVTLEDQGKGVRIAQLNPGSLAETYGLKAGDRIVELAGRAPGSSAEVSAAIRRQPPGTWLPFKVARKDGEVEIIVRFPPQAPAPTSAQPQPQPQP